MTDRDKDSIRKQVHALLAALTPAEAKVLRARYGLDAADSTDAVEDSTLRSMARGLYWKKKTKQRR